MYDWRPILIPEIFANLDDPPDRAWEATTPDLRPFQVVIWGSGRPQDPIRLYCRMGAPESEEEDCQAPARFPDLLELEEVVNRFTPTGALVSLGNIVSLEPNESGFIVPEGTPWAGFAMTQVGAAVGSEAGARSTIVIAGRNYHAPQN